MDSEDIDESIGSDVFSSYFMEVLFTKLETTSIADVSDALVGSLWP